ncbi:NAD-dependent epimerase/dehydratase family protein [Streptomyces sp. NPDC054770]
MVTGGAGFIGSHLTDALLAEGHRVDVIDDLSTGNAANLQDASGQPGFAFHRCDLGSAEAAGLMQDVRPDALLMLGAQMSVKVSMRDPLLDARVNVLGQLNLLEAAVEAGTRRVVFATSGGTIYGNVAPEALPVPETAHGDPDSFYGLTKRLAVDYLRLYRDHRGLESVALALGNVYGPRQDPRGEAGVVAIFANRIRQGEECVVNGDGSVTRDFVYISDVVAAFLAALERGSGLVNVGTGVETSVLDVHRELARHTPSAPRPRFGPPLPGEIARIALDSTLALRELGWRAQVSFQEGVERLLAATGLDPVGQR